MLALTRKSERQTVCTDNLSAKTVDLETFSLILSQGCLYRCSEYDFRTTNKWYVLIMQRSRTNKTAHKPGTE